MRTYAAIKISGSVKRTVIDIRCMRGVKLMCRKKMNMLRLKEN